MKNIEYLNKINQYIFDSIHNEDNDFLGPKGKIEYAYRRFKKEFYYMKEFSVIMEVKNEQELFASYLKANPFEFCTYDLDILEFYMQFNDLETIKYSMQEQLISNYFEHISFHFLLLVDEFKIN